MPWIKRGINRFIPSVIWQPSPQVPITLKEMSADGIILDIGAGGRQIAPHVLGVDSIPFVNTCLVADIHNLPFVDNSVDGIFCTGTLEHVEDPHRAMSEMYRILKLNCLIHLEVPFIQPFHKDPQDYWRWTLDGLHLFARQHGFQEIRKGIHLGPTSAMNALIIAYSQSWFHSRYIRKAIDLALSWILFPFKYLDAFLNRSNKDMPAGVYYVGCKGNTGSLASTSF
jgi:SAM-dependent methyltransferase